MTKYQNLFAGDFPQSREAVTIGSAQTLKAGCILGKKTATAGAKGKFSFALSAITAAEGSVTLYVGESGYTVVTTAESTIANILADLVSAVNDDSSCGFAATADAASGNIILEANAIGAYANDVNIRITTSGVTLTVGAKVVVTAGVDFANGEYFAVDSSKSDGTQTACAMLLEDVTTGASATATACVTHTGEVSASALSFGGTDTVAKHKDALAARCLFIKTTSPISGN